MVGCVTGSRSGSRAPERRSADRSPASGRSPSWSGPRRRSSARVHRSCEGPTGDEYPSPSWPRIEPSRRGHCRLYGDGGRVWLTPCNGAGQRPPRKADRTGGRRPGGCYGHGAVVLVLELAPAQGSPHGTGGPKRGRRPRAGLVKPLWSAGASVTWPVWPASDGRGRSLPRSDMGYVGDMGSYGVSLGR